MVARGQGCPPAAPGLALTPRDARVVEEGGSKTVRMLLIIWSLAVLTLVPGAATGQLPTGGAPSGDGSGVPLAPDPPTMTAEPAYTQGLTNTVSWTDESSTGASEYYAERAQDAAFSVDLASSGWIADLSHEFAGLADGQVYYYRVKARDDTLGESGWSGTESSTQDTTAPATSAQDPGGTQTSLTFDVPFVASDATSGVDFVELWYQVDAGGYVQFPGTFTTSPISFTAPSDGAYDLYTTGTDSVGNVEAAPALADASTVVDTSAPDAPTITAEPAYTQGAANTVLWSDESASGANAYFAERAEDELFTVGVASSGWITGLSFEFTTLADGQTYHYRVKARDAALNESGWSASVSSTQDASPPVTEATDPGTYQTGLTFDVPFTATDSTSGVDYVELWYEVDAGGYVQFPGTFTTSPVAFTAPSDGAYDFYTIGTDSLGNIEDPPGGPDASTTVDTAAPDVPTLAAEPTYTQGTANTVEWSDESVSGAADYYAEAAEDAGFSVGVVASGWVAGLTHEFSTLAGGQMYYYRVRARDDALNESGWSDAVSSTQDATAPTTAAGALDGFQTATTFDVPFTALDATSGVDYVELWYEVDAGGYVQFPGTFTTSPISFDAPVEGAYDFYTIGTDAVGNVETAPGVPDASTVVDTTAPSAPSIALEPPYTQGLANTVTWTDESASGAAEYYAERDDGLGVREVVGSGWVAGTEFEFEDLADGQAYSYRVKARDAALNESGWSATVVSTQDATPPVSSAQDPGAVQTALTFDVPFAASDATSGVDYVELWYQADGAGYVQFAGTYAASPISFTAPGDGAYDFYTVGADAVGNVEDPPLVPDASTVVDATPPDSPEIDVEPAYTQGTSNTVSWSDESASGAVEYYVERDDDLAGREVVGSGWIAETSFEFVDLADGQEYSYRVRSRDAVLNESGWSESTISTQDATPPESAALDPGAVQSTYTFDLPFSATDATSGVDHVELWYQLDGGGYTQDPGTYTTSPISFTAPALGAYQFYTIGTDVAANVENPPSVADAVTVVDPIAPDAPTMVSEPPYTQGLSNTVSWSDESASEAIEYYAEREDVPPFMDAVGSGWIAETSFEFTDLVDGQEYSYRVKARDAALNESEWSDYTNSIQDDTPPSTAAQDPGAYQTSFTFPVPFTALDATSGTEFVELWYQVDAGGFQQFPGSFDASPISFTAAVEGSYEFYTTGTDSVGNAEDAPAGADASTVVDVTAPDAPTMVDEPPYTQGLSNEVEWSDESASGASEYKVQYAWDADFTTGVTESAWLALTSNEFELLADGQIYHYRVRSRDVAGNESEWSNVVNSSQDDSPPITLAQDPGAYQTVDTFDVPFAAADATSGVEYVELWYQVDGGGYSLYGGAFTTSPISFTAAVEGEYDFYTVGADSVGNVEDAPTVPDATTIVDMTGPDAPTMTPEPTFTQGLANSVAWSDEAASGAVEYYVESDDGGGSREIVASGWIAATSHEFADLLDGQEYSYRVRARDEALNEGDWSEYTSSMQDDSPPSTAADDPGASQASLTFGVPFSGNDATSGVEFVELWYRLDGGSYEQHPGTYSLSPISFTASGDGVYDFYTVGTDGVGNVEAAPDTPDASTAVDTTPPSVPTMAGEPVYTAGLANTVSWTDESASGAVEYFAEAATPERVGAEVIGSGWIADTSFEFTDLTDAEAYLFRVMARDTLQNESGWSDVVVSIQDDSPPITMALDPGALHTEYTFDVPFTAVDATSGVEYVELWYQLDGGGFELFPGTHATSPISFTATGDGSYDFYTVGTDSVGNIENVPLVPDASTEVDVIGPDVPVMEPEPAYTSSLSNVVSWTDESPSGATEYYVEATSASTSRREVIGSDWIVETSFEFSDLSDGVAYSYAVKGRDAALNESAWSAPVVSTQDDSPPETHCDDPGEYQNSLTFGVPISVTDSASGVEYVELWYSVDGGPFVQYPGTFTTSPIPFVAPGEVLCEFYTIGTDGVGNIEAAPGAPDCSTVVDTTGPATPDLVGEDEFTQGLSNTIYWSDEGPSGAVEYYAEARSEGGPPTQVFGSGWVATTSHEFTHLTDGETYSYRVKARDAADNETEWSAETASTQDGSGPVTSVVGTPAYTGTTTFDVPFLASDATTGVSHVELWYKLDGGGYSQYPGSFTESPILFTAPGEGAYQLYTTGTDSIGNVEAAPPGADRTVVVDMTAPPNVVRAGALPGHNQIGLSWTLPQEGDVPVDELPEKGAPIHGTLIVRKEWGPGAYPEYDDVIESAEFPQTPDDGTTVAYLARADGTSYVDDGFDDSSRNAYLYAFFSRDEAGNYSEASTAAVARTTSYVLGDVDDRTGTPGVYDGSVDFYDKLKLSMSYDTVQGDAHYLPELDVGPTDTGDGHGIPLTDDAIDFEDLMIVSLNSGSAGETYRRSLPVPAGGDAGGPLTLSLQVPGERGVRAGVLEISLVLSGNAGSVKGISSRVSFDPARLELIGIEAGEVPAPLEDLVFFYWTEASPGEVDIDIAALGRGTTLGGSGELARLRLRVVSDEPAGLSISEAGVRDVRNEPLPCDLHGYGSQGTEVAAPVLSLKQNVPNPFNPRTTIAFDLPKPMAVSLTVYDAGGRRVRDLAGGEREEGRHEVVWDGTDGRGESVASGVYFYVLQAGSERLTGKMVLMR